MKHLAWLLCWLTVGSVAQAKFEITNIQPAYGLFGAPRTTDDVYPLDEYVVRFHLVGVKTSPDGKSDCELAIRLTNADGKAVLDNKIPQVRILSLGGDMLATFATVGFSENVPPGVYTLTISVRDRLANETASFERKLTCKPGEFRILAPRFFHDPEGKLAAGPIGLVGETLHYRLRVAGYEKAQKLSLTLKAEVLDSDGKAINAKPLVLNAETADPVQLSKSVMANFSGTVFLHRVGEYRLRITVEDNVGKKSTTYETPLKVLAP